MTLSTQDALIHLMVVTAAADRTLTGGETDRISGLVARLPVFEGYDPGRVGAVVEAAIAKVTQSGDIEVLLEEILAGVPERLHDTAYALAVEIAAVDLNLEQEELRWLEMLRDHLMVERLVTAAIERAARARLRRA
jgi:hypothetical protein